jgi:hypothetical protein
MVPAQNFMKGKLKDSKSQGYLVTFIFFAGLLSQIGWSIHIKMALSRGFDIIYIIIHLYTHCRYYYYDYYVDPVCYDHRIPPQPLPA